MTIEAQDQKRSLHEYVLGDAKIKLEATGEAFTHQDSCMQCLLRKRFDTPYVSPIDGDLQGVDAKTRQRYWTVTDKGSYQRVVAAHQAAAPLAKPRDPGIFRRTLTKLFGWGQAAA